MGGSEQSDRPPGDEFADTSPDRPAFDFGMPGVTPPPPMAPDASTPSSSPAPPTPPPLVRGAIHASAWSGNGPAPPPPLACGPEAGRTGEQARNGPSPEPRPWNGSSGETGAPPWAGGPLTSSVQALDSTASDRPLFGSASPFADDFATTRLDRPLFDAAATSPPATGWPSAAPPNLPPMPAPSSGGPTKPPIPSSDTGLKVALAAVMVIIVLLVAAIVVGLIVSLSPAEEARGEPLTADSGALMFAARSHR